MKSSLVQDDQAELRESVKNAEQEESAKGGE
jgi:hypothetical protein